MTQYDLAIVGGGIVGACVAEEAAHIGARTIVLDAGAHPGHATASAAGVAVPSLRYLDDPEFYAWLWQGRSLLDADIRRLEPTPGDFSVARPLVRALRPADADTVAAALTGHGDTAWMDHGEAVAAAPGTRLPEDRRYLVEKGGLMVDGAGYLAAVRDAATAAGVTWCQGGTVLATEVAHDGVRLVTTTDEPPPCVLSSSFYLAPGLTGDVVVGATEDDAGFVAEPTVAGTSRLLRFALAVAPWLATARPAEPSAGLRPVTPTGRPLVGRVPGHDRLYLATGHAGHGLLSARATAVGLLSGIDRGAWESLPLTMCPTETARRLREAAA